MNHKIQSGNVFMNQNNMLQLSEDNIFFSKVVSILATRSLYYTKIIANLSFLLNPSRVNSSFNWSVYFFDVIKHKYNRSLCFPVSKKQRKPFLVLFHQIQIPFYKPGVKTRLVVPEGEEVIHSEDSTASNINHES